MNRKTFFIVIMCFVLLTTGCTAQKKPEQSPQPQQNQGTQVQKTLFETTRDDPYKEGCASCHIRKDNNDYRLSEMVKNIPGHPEVKENSTVNDCYVCHGTGKTNQVFIRTIHKEHAKSETFSIRQEGKCSACHTMEGDGDVKIKGLTEAPPPVQQPTKKVEKKAEPKEKEVPKEQTPAPVQPPTTVPQPPPVQPTPTPNQQPGVQPQQ